MDIWSECTQFYVDKLENVKFYAAKIVTYVYKQFYQVFFFDTNCKWNNLSNKTKEATPLTKEKISEQLHCPFTKYFHLAIANPMCSC